MAASLDLEKLRNAGLRGLTEAVADQNLWEQWTQVLAQAGMCTEGTHGKTTEFRGRPVQPVVVWTYSEPTGEQAMTYFFPTA